MSGLLCPFNLPWFRCSVLPNASSDDCVFPNLNYIIIMSNSTCWLSFFDSSSRSLLPPNNLRDSMTKLFLSQRGKARLLSSVALTVLMAVFFSQSSFAQELILNPGFESKLTGWQSNKNPIRTIAATNPVYAGTYAAHINNAYQDNEYFYQNLNASPFGKYSFSVWAMVHDASKWSSVGVNVFDANWTKIPSASFELEVNSTTFQKYSKDFTVPGNARYFQVYGYTEWTVLKVDDYSLTQAVGGTPTGTLSKTCKIENFRKCDGTSLGYGPWLNILVNGAGGGSNNEYNVTDLTWKEYSDNTATVKGTITKKSDATVAFAVDLLLSGRTTVGTGHFSAVDNASFCVGQKGADWYFYPNASGTLIGTGTSVAGSQINVTLDPSMPWQVGTGGTTRFKDSFGSSAWLNLCVAKQPTSSGKVLDIGKEGTDFYLEMPGCTPVLCNNVTSGGTIGSNQSGCSGFDPAAFTSVADPSGGAGTLEYVWLKSTTATVLTSTNQGEWFPIVGANASTFDAGALSKTTSYIRCSRRAGCTDYVGESNVITVTINANCGGKDPVCLSRKFPVQNSSLCGDATKSYGMWFSDLKGNVASPNQQFSVKSGELTEFCDGTAVLTYTACVVGGGANDCITATVNYSGRTGTPPASSPVLNTHCTTYTPNVGDWYYYPTSSGSFSGAGIYAGLAGTYTQNMGAFQLGTGGSLNDISKFGASSWFKIGITNGGTNNWSTVSKDGDININLGTSTHIASVTATANPASICKGENVVLTAAIDAASKSANCSPTYSWVGSNGFTSNQATVTNNNVQGATTYTVTVTFTAINGSKCSVTATTGVALNAVCCDNVTNGGQIAANQRSCGAFDPAPFTDAVSPSGGSGVLEYVWLKSTTTTTYDPSDPASASQWFPIAGSNSAGLDLLSITKTTAFVRCSRRAGCTDYVGESNEIVVTIDPAPAAPTTTPAAICGTGTVTLGATCTTGVPQWYVASTGGAALATGASFTTPSISANTTYYVSCKTPQGCESSPRTEAVATINSNASAPTVTPATICGTGTATLGATCSSGVAQWFTAATGGASIATGASFTTPSISTTTTYYVSCKSNAGCESARVEVKATVIGKITDGGKIQFDENICPGKTPSQITSATPASGGDANLAIEYLWLQSTSLTNGVCPQNIVGQTLYSPISGATSTDYQPGVITQTTCYIRCSRRAGCTDYIGGESNIVKKTLLATCQGKDPICLSRKTPVENSSFCGDATKSYGMYFSDLKGNVASPNQLFSVKSGELTEFCDGTAVLNYTACVTGGGAGDCITATVNYSGRTGTPPVGSPVSNTHCTNYNPSVADWYYYPVSNGTFSGAGIYAGLTGTYTQNMGAFQVGTGGSLNDIAKFGASSWFKINITNGGTNNWTTATKDGDININLGTSTTIASVTATANPKAICSGEKVDLTATLDVNSKSANCSPTYAWVGSNGFTSTQATATNTNVTTSTTYTVTVTFTAVNGSKCSVTATTGITVNPIPNPPTVTPAAICGTGTVTLGATCSTGTAQWYSAATGGASIATGASFTTPSISATTTYYVSCKTDATCESARTPVTATVNPIPATPTVKPTAICGTGTVTLGATCTTGTAQWYAAATGGASIATGASFTTPVISVTTTYYVSCKTDATCESSRMPVTATVNTVPNSPTVTPVTTCGTGSVTLGATCTTGVAQWYSSATGGIALATGASFTTPSLSATTTYYVSCKSTEGCESAKTEVKAIVIVKITDGGSIKADEIICVGGTPSKITSVTSPTGGDPSLAIEYVWLQTTSLTATGTCPLNIVGQTLYTAIPNTNTPDYQPGAITVATCYIRCSRRAGCLDYIGGESNTVKKSVEAFPTAPTVTPAAICGTGTVTLGATCSTGATAMWYAASTGGASIATGASFTTPSISATTIYYVSCKTNAAGCESNRTPVTATINPIPNAPTGTPAAICGSGSVTLGATCATGVAQWYVAATGGASVSTGATFTTPSISATTPYYVSCKTTEGCESSRTPVTATVNPIPNAPTTKGDAICGSGTVTLGGTCATGVAQWYVATTGGASVSTGASFTTPSISSTITYYVSCKTTEGCESGRTPVTATVNPIPNAPTVTPAAICGTGTVTLGATCATGVAQWYTGATGGASVSTGASFTTPSISSTTPYYVSCKTTEGCESSRTPVTATINPIPNAPTVKGAETCGSGSVTLGATCATGVAQWYAAATGGSSIATGASYTTPSLTATTSYYVSCKSAEGCESGRTEVKAIVIGKITDGGTIKADETICVGGTPSKITNVTPASGGDATRAIEYVWLQTTSLTNGVCPANVVGQNLYTEILNTNTADYQPSAITQTTCYIRCSRRNGCTDYIGGESNTVKKTVEATPNAPTVTPAAICGTGTVTLGATCATGVAQWYAVATGGASIATGASFTTSSISATTTYYVSCKTIAGGCESGRTSVTATINPIPASPSAIKNASICGAGTVELGAICTVGTPQWYAASTGGASIATGATFTTPSLSATTTYYVSCKSTEGCESGRTPVTATINANTTAPTVTPAAICGTGTVKLGAACTTGVAQWYTAATGGASVSTGASFTTPSISSTTTYYVSCKSDAGCESMRTPVTATINMIPNAPTVKGDAICGAGTVTLGATCAMGTANWYAASTGGTSIATGASFTTPSLSITTSYYVSCKSAEGCESGRTEVKVTVNAIPTAPTVKGDAICGTGTVTLGATCATGTANWYSAATDGASIATGASYTTPSISATTTYYVSCKSTEGCESGRTPVTATINANTTAPTVNGDAICGTGTVTLGATCTTGTANWYAASTGGTSIATGASFTTPSLTTTTSYYVSCKSSAGCESARTEVKATINAIPAAPTTKGDAICGTGTVTLGATCATGTANWYAASTGGTSIATGASFTTPSLSATTSYYVSCKSAEGCESARTPVTATVNGNATAPTTTPAAICGTGTVTLGATCATGIANWYTTATGGASVATGASFITPSLSATTTYYVSCKTDAGCESGRTPVVATVNSNGTAPTVTPAAICGTGTVTLGATCATGTANWYISATGGTSIATGASFTTPSLTTTTSYYVSCKSSAGCESPRTEVKATVIGKITDGGTIKADETICAGGTPSKIVNVTLPTGGDASLAIEYLWLKTTTLTNGVCPQNIVGQNVYSPIPNTNATDYQPGAITQTTCYIRCSRRKGCTDYDGESNAVKKTVESAPNAPTVTPAAICGTGTVTLGATCTTGIANWYTAATGGASVATGASFTTPSISATTTYYVSCKTTAGGCESARTAVTATVNSAGTAPTVTPATTCGTGTVTLGATCSTGTATWYSSATGGTSIATGASFTTPSLTTTTSYYVSCKSTAGCESPRTEVKATVIGKITDGGTIKADETICAGITPSKIVNVTLPTGGDASLAIEYIWLKTTSLGINGACPANVVGQNLYTEIPGSTTPDYQPDAITQTTCYVRCSRRKGCTDYIGGESNYVKKTVTSPFTISATTNPNAVCNGTTVTVTTTTTATGTITYSWTGPGGFTANTKDLSIPNVTLAANGVYTITASNGGGCSAVATVHVKVVSCLKIGDLVFNDKNNNGKQDAGELGIAGVTVKLFDSANNQVGSSVTTDANGNYLFSNLPSGTYTVEISAPAGYKSSTGTNGSATGAYEPTTGSTNVNNEDNGTTTSGQIIRSKPVVLTTTDNTNVDFGLFRPAKLGDYVFRDSNGDGKQDAGEVGVANVTVKLFDGANNLVATTTTDLNGKYLFDNLTAGNYTVEFVKSTLPSGLGFSPQGTTTGDKDSDANVSTGKTATITLSEGQTNNDIDAGLTGPCDKDVTPPVLSACPYDVLIKTRGTVATVSWTAPTATDECGTPVITSTNASGSQFPVGSTIVTYTATDAKGNKTTCSFKVTVVKIITCDVDTQAPVFYDCPTDITLNTTGTGVVVNWDHPSVGDNCGIPSVVFNYSPGQTFPVGVTTVIYTAKDAKGNTSYCMFKVTVIKKTTLSTPVTGATSARVVAVEEVKVGNEVNVYPNPTSSDFSIELSAELMKANSSVEVSVFNMTGTTQFTQTAAGTERVSVKVPVQDMPSGTYFVNVALDNGRMIIKKLQILK